MNKGIILLTIFAMTVFLTGCGEQASTGRTFVGGNEGLKISFAEGNPPSVTTDGGTGGFNIIVKMQNLGESTIDANDGYVQIWGPDPQTYGASWPDFKKMFSDQDGFGTELRGAVMSNGQVLSGGIATIDFTDLKYIPIIPGESPPQPIWANVCYKYKTRAVAQICVKNNVEQALSGKEICDVEGEKSPQNSGAPIQVTSLKESYAGNGKIGLMVTITHTGSGDNFFKDDSLECNDLPSNTDAGKVRVTFEDVQVSGRTVPVVCTGLDNDGYVRLYSESGKETYNLYCTVDVSGSNNVVNVPVSLELSYTYLQHVESNIVIRHVAH
jgi:hypothetical protein